MNWLILDKLIDLASRIWDRFTTKKPSKEPIASQLDIAIGVASSETARQEGHRAAQMAKNKKGLPP